MIKTNAMDEPDTLVEKEEDDFWKSLEVDYKEAVRSRDQNAILTAYAEAFCMGESNDTIDRWRMEVEIERTHIPFDEAYPEYKIE